MTHAVATILITLALVAAFIDMMRLPKVEDEQALYDKIEAGSRALEYARHWLRTGRRA